MEHFEEINGSELPNVINQKLVELNNYACGAVKVFQSDISIPNKGSKMEFEKKLREEVENPDDYVSMGTCSMLKKKINREGTLILTSCRETKANKFTYHALMHPEQLEEIAIQNSNNELIGHSGVIYYTKGFIYFYEPRLDMQSEEFSKRTITFKFSQRLKEFLNLGLPVYKIFVGGDEIPENCRKKSLIFIRNMIDSLKRGKQCTSYIFYEFVRGPRAPSPDRFLMTINAIPGNF